VHHPPLMKITLHTYEIRFIMQEANHKMKDGVDVNSWQNLLLQMGKSDKWRKECKYH